MIIFLFKLVISAFFLPDDRGLLKIAEVESRFHEADEKPSDKNVKAFCEALAHFGFKLKSKNLEYELFVFIDLKKVFHFKPIDEKGNPKELPKLELKACVYKKR